MHYTQVWESKSVEEGATANSVFGRREPGTGTFDPMTNAPSLHVL